MFPVPYQYWYSRGGGGVVPVDADDPPAEVVPDEAADSVPDEVVDEVVEPVDTVDVVDGDVVEENGADPDIISIDDPPANDTPGGPCGPCGPGGPCGPSGPGGPGGAGQSLTGMKVKAPVGIVAPSNKFLGTVIIFAVRLKA
jgi:hypothetical protein